MNRAKNKIKSKIISPEDLPTLVRSLRDQNKTIATLNGSFDLLHAGHLHILSEAAQICDVLIVALNTDASVQKYKSRSRPIIPLQYRVELIAALECVNFVTWFDETDPRNLLQIISPDIHVNGEEYGNQCIEADVVKAQGGKLHLVNRIPGLATSEIITKIKTLCD